MNNKEFIGKYIAFLHRDGKRFLENELEPYHIGSSQFYILMPLFKADGVNQESLSQSIKVDKAAITRAIQKLIDEGYVIRQKDEEDKRSYRVFLTKKARLIEPDIVKIAIQWEDILLSGFDTDHRNLIEDSFKEMINNVSRTNGNTIW